jgi:N-acetylneuraminic acid mutarotase
LVVTGLINYSSVDSPKQLELIEASLSEISWTAGTNMPTPRTEGTSAEVDGKIYIIGGSDKNQKYVNTVEVYDATTNKWSTAAPLPIPVHHTGSATYNGKIYVVGGFGEGKKPTDSLLIYDPVTDKWQKGKPLPGPRGALTADFINGTLYAIGGIDASHSPVATNEAYDPKTNTWTEKAPMPTARHHHTTAVVDDKLYVIGGRLLGNGVQSQINEALSNLNDNEMYNPLNESWTVMEQMPTKRSGIAAASSPVDGNVYVFGGQSTDGAFDITERYNPKINKWSTEEPMPTARLGLAAEKISNKMYVIGGKEGFPGISATGANEILTINNTSGKALN